MLPIALGTFVFDAVIENGDRRPANPNCLVARRTIALIDHELAFPATVIGSLGPPWSVGGMEWLASKDKHIFFPQLRRQARKLDYHQLRESWSGVRDADLEMCRSAIPAEWKGAGPMVERALGRIRQARSNVDGLVTEVQRVLG